MYFQNPSIARRYLATLIDLLLVLSMLVIISYVFKDADNKFIWLRLIISLGLFFIYEPLCTSKYSTIGQQIMGIRVRSIPNLKHISLFAAYIRIFVKLSLGWISFLTIPFTDGKRGIHDFAAQTIVIYARDEN